MKDLATWRLYLYRRKDGQKFNTKGTITKITWVTVTVDSKTLIESVIREATQEKNKNKWWLRLPYSAGIYGFTNYHLRLKKVELDGETRVSSTTSFISLI